MPARNTIFVVDDDAAVRDSLSTLLESADFHVIEFDSAPAFLAGYAPGAGTCLIVDVRMPDMDGLTLQQEMLKRQWTLPVIVVTGHADVALAVRAMKAGAVDLIEKPFDDEVLLASVARAAEAGRRALSETSAAREAESRIGQLTAREREVLEHLVAGRANKVVAHKLNISPRTVEVHRARLMDKMGARSLSDLVRAALAAGLTVAPEG